MRLCLDIQQEKISRNKKTIILTWEAVWVYN